jgi:hypothetical protein
MEAQQYCPLLVGQFAMVQRGHRISRIGSLSTVRGIRELDPQQGRQLTAIMPVCRQLEHGEQVVSLPVRVMIAELRLIRRKAFLPSSH